MALLASESVASHQTFQTRRSSPGRNHSTTVHSNSSHLVLHQGSLEEVLRLLPPCACLCLCLQVPSQLQSQYRLPYLRSSLLRGSRESQVLGLSSGTIRVLLQRLPSRQELSVPAQVSPAVQILALHLQPWPSPCCHQDQRSRVSILTHYSDGPAQRLRTYPPPPPIPPHCIFTCWRLCHAFYCVPFFPHSLSPLLS